jgi:hypothetical protein
VNKLAQENPDDQYARLPVVTKRSSGVSLVASHWDRLIRINALRRLLADTET